MEICTKKGHSFAAVGPPYYPLIKRARRRLFGLLAPGLEEDRTKAFRPILCSSCGTVGRIAVIENGFEGRVLELVRREGTRKAQVDLAGALDGLLKRHDVLETPDKVGCLTCKNQLLEGLMGELALVREELRGEPPG